VRGAVSRSGGELVAERVVDAVLAGDGDLAPVVSIR
jgi:hypothetical protein